MQWEIGDSVKDWLDKWRTENPSQTLISLESEGKLGVGIATIYRLNQDIYYLPFQATQDKLAHFKVNGVSSGSKGFGYFGYPPVDDNAGNGSNKKVSPFAITQSELESRLRNDFDSIINQAELSRGFCWFKHRCVHEESDRASVVPGDQWKVTQRTGYNIYASTNTTKRYGPILGERQKTFELALFVCEKCLVNIKPLLISPVSKIIGKIRAEQKRSVQRIASDLGVSIGNVYRLAKDKNEFIEAALLEDILKLCFFKSRQDEDLVDQFRAAVEETIEENGLVEYMDDLEFDSRELLDNDLIDGSQLLLHSEDSRSQWVYEGELEVLETEFLEWKIDVNGVQYLYDVAYKVMGNTGYPHFEDLTQHYNIEITFLIASYDKGYLYDLQKTAKF